MSSFLDNARILGLSAVISTFFSFFGTFLIGIFFSPDDYGVYRLVLIWGGVLSIFLTFRLELSLMSASNKKEFLHAATIVHSFILFTFCIFLLIYFFIDSESHFKLLGFDKNISLTMLLIGLIAALIEVQKQSLVYFSNVRLLSLQNILIPCLFCLGVIASAESEIELSLIISRIIVLVATYILIIILFARPRFQFSFREIFQYLSSKRDFPLKNVPYSVISQFSLSFPIWFLIYIGNPYLAGIFAFLTTLSFFPGMILNSSIGPLFFKKAQLLFEKQKEHLVEFIQKLVSFIFLLALPLFLLFLAVDKVIIGFIFGNQWIDSELDISLIFISGFLYLFSSWPERIFVVTGTQGIILKFQIFFDSLSIIGLVILYYLGFEAAFLLQYFILINWLYHSTYISMSLFVSGNDTVYAIKSGFIIFTIVMFFLIMNFISEYIPINLWIVSVSSISIIYYYIFRNHINNLMLYLKTI